MLSEGSIIVIIIIKKDKTNAVTSIDIKTGDLSLWSTKSSAVELYKSMHHERRLFSNGRQQGWRRWAFLGSCNSKCESFQTISSKLNQAHWFLYLYIDSTAKNKGIAKEAIIILDKI